ncbi:hypothetical protein JKF63_02135 [Porcisia hertigi]|uniref:F-box domain-containing protein n=1 Tax=Porcisia hertigi TaxID=2761500 RepID=A0A836L2R6_9TRYP|nr:hypothetical protein JKF63_02135 [Porcisia hertigi]
MSTWASRLASKKPYSPTPATEGDKAAALRNSPALSSTASPVGVVSNKCVSADVSAGNVSSAVLHEEFRAVAEAYNSLNVCPLRLPPDCWDVTTKYLSYIDVVALAHTCRTLWAVLHNHGSVWKRQLRYFYHDVRDLRGGKLLCTASLFPESACIGSVSRQVSTEALTRPSIRHAVSRDAQRRSPMPAYERFFQERRVYVLDLRRELHFQELADVEDKPTGMFTVALHDGFGEAAATPASSLFADPLSPSDAWSTSAFITPSPFLANALDNAHDWLAATPSPPASFAASQAQASPAPGPMPPYRRTMSAQANGTPSGNRPAAAPSTPPLLPHIGEPIISDHNPPLHLRVYAIEATKGTGSRGREAVEMTMNPGRSDDEDRRNDTSNISSSIAGMTEEQVLEHVMRLSLAEAQQASAPRPPSPPDADTPSNGNLATADALGSDERQERKSYQHRHYRGATPAASLPLSELLAILDALANNALDQLQHHHVWNCTEDEDPAFLRRLSETFRSAKHRRLHLGNHHRAVRNNGQTTRNRLGRSFDAGASDARSFSLSAANAAGTTTPPQHPPPMNRMLHKFSGVLLEITEREAKMVAGTLLGMPGVIDEFVVFRCYDPSLLYRKLNTPGVAHDRDFPSVAAGNTLEATLSTKKSSVLPDTASPITWGTAEAGISEVVYKPATTRTPLLKPLPFFTRFFLAPELCCNGYIGLFVVDVIRVLVIVEKEVVTTDNPDWSSPSITRGGRLIVHGQGLNAQAPTREDYSHVPPDLTRRRGNLNLGG